MATVTGRRTACWLAAALLLLPVHLSRAVPGAWADPQHVVIVGYAGDAMEPFLSLDGRVLFFNNRNTDPDTDLHWATRIDGLHFRYRGRVVGANSTALDAVASQDRTGELYFISTRSYDTTASTVYRAAFVNGRVTRLQLVPGLTAPTPLRVIFDAAIDPGGRTLWYADGLYTPAGGPVGADLAVAERTDTGFTRRTDSALLFAAVNTPSLEYAPAISADGLELYFTRLDGPSTSIYVASRTSATAPFGLAGKVNAINGNVEAPALAADGRSLYYHRLDGARHVIYRVTRTGR